MFTPSMTREEIVAEAKQDFNQLKAFMQVELNAFGRRYNRKYNNSCITHGHSKHAAIIRGRSSFIYATMPLPVCTQ